MNSKVQKKIVEVSKWYFVKTFLLPARNLISSWMTEYWQAIHSEPRVEYKYLFACGDLLIHKLSSVSVCETPFEQ